MSIKNVISVRRMVYLKTILDRHESEITKKVYTEMKNKPYKGDWIHIVVKDFQKIGVEMDETVIKNTEHIQCENTRIPQKYLTNGRMDNKSTSLLYNLRCQSTQSIW